MKPHLTDHRSRRQLGSGQRLVLSREAERWLADRAADTGTRERMLDATSRDSQEVIGVDTAEVGALRA